MAISPSEIPVGASTIKVLPCSLARGTEYRVPRCEVQRGRLATKVLQAANTEASQLRQQGQEYLAQMQQQAALIRQDAEAQAKRDLKRWQKKAKTEAVADAVQWLVSQAELEQTLIRSLRERISDQIRRVIMEWAMVADPAPLLVKRLTQLVEEQVVAGTLLLKVPPENAPEIASLFGQRLTVIPDAELRSGQALLCSSLQIVKVDIHQHLERLLAQLTDAVEQGEDYGQN